VQNTGPAFDLPTFFIYLIIFLLLMVVLVGAVSWGTVLQAGKSRVRLSMMSLDFFIDNPSSRTMALGSTQPLIEMSTRNVSWEWRRPVLRTDNLTTFVCRLFWNLGASTSWNPQGLSRLVMGFLKKFLSLIYMFNIQFSPNLTLLLPIRYSSNTFI